MGYLSKQTQCNTGSAKVFYVAVPRWKDTRGDMDTLSTNSFPWFLCVQKEVSEVVVVVVTMVL